MMAKVNKPFPVNFVIYYRNMPEAVENLPKIDAQLSIIKDGLKKMNEQIDAPRLTLTLYPVRKDIDRNRLTRIISLLDGLLKRDEILSYSLS